MLDLSADGVNARVPDVSVDLAGNATAVWHLSVVIAQAASRPAGEAWGSAADLGSGSHVEVASSGPGRALAVWMSYEGSAFVVRAALRPTADGDWGSSVPVSGDDPGPPVCPGSVSTRPAMPS